MFLSPLTSTASPANLLSFFSPSGSRPSSFFNLSISAAAPAAVWFKRSLRSVNASPTLFLAVGLPSAPVKLYVGFVIVPSSPTVAPPPSDSANPLAALCNWLPVTASLESAATLPSFRLDNVVGPPF